MQISQQGFDAGKTLAVTRLGGQITGDDRRSNVTPDVNQIVQCDKRLGIGIAQGLAVMWTQLRIDKDTGLLCLKGSARGVKGVDQVAVAAVKGFISRLRLVCGCGATMFDGAGYPV